MFRVQQTGVVGKSIVTLSEIQQQRDEMKMVLGHMLKLKEEFQETSGGQLMLQEIKLPTKFLCILQKAITMIMAKS